METRHTYKVCELQPKEPGKRGRHKRVVLMDFPQIGADELTYLRKTLEPRLQPNQVAELDAKIVARGSAVDEEDEEHEGEAVQADEEALEVPDEVAEDDLEDVELRGEASAATDPVAATRFSIRMLWLAQKRHAAASEELCKRTSALTEKTLEQWKKVDDALTEVSALRREILKEKATDQAKPPSPGVSMQDIMEIMRTGATIWREVVTSTPTANKPPEA